MTEEQQKIWLNRNDMPAERARKAAAIVGLGLDAARFEKLAEVFATYEALDYGDEPKPSDAADQSARGA